MNVKTFIGLIAAAAVFLSLAVGPTYASGTGLTTDWHHHHHWRHWHHW